MSAHTQGPWTLTIANGGTDSGLLSAQLTEGQRKLLFGNAVKCVIQAPSAVTGTITVQVCAALAGTMTTLQINGTDVTLAAGKTNMFSLGAIADLRIHSSGAEAAQRDFIIAIQDDIGSPS